MTIHTLGLFASFQVTWMLRDGLGLRHAGRHVARLSLGAALAAGLVAAQALPTLALAAESGRTTAGLQGKFLEIYDPMSPAFFLANLVNPVRDTIRREYFGWIPLVCFALGFRLWGRDRPAVFGSLLSLLAIVLCFGSQTPVYAAYRALPLGAAFRLPDRFVFLFSLGFALVAASGLDRVIEVRGNLRARIRPLAPRFIAVLALGLALFLALDSLWLEAGLENAARPWGWFAYYGLAHDHFAAIDRAIAYFAAATALLVAFAWRVHARGGRALQVAVLLFAAADLGFALKNAFLHPAREPAPALAGSSCYEEVPAIAGEFGRHLSFRLPQSHALKDKDGELYSRYSATHYDPLVTRRHAAYFEALQEGGTPFFRSPWTHRSLFMGFLSGTPPPERMTLLDLMGVRVVLVDERRKLRPPALDAFLDRLRRVGRCHVAAEDGAIPVALYENPSALPRAFIVHRVGGVAGPEEAVRRLVEPGFDPRREAVIEGTAPPQLAPDGGDGVDRVEVPIYGANHAVVRVETDRAGLVVLTDTYDPEWVVTRNGEKVRVHPTDALFRGVFVPAGRSELVFRYRPRRFHWGAAISAVTAAFGAIFWMRTRPKAQQRRHPS
jgi:hypothetical protein